AACALIALAASGWGANKTATGSYLTYVGTYTNKGKSEGVYSFRFDSATGKLTAMGLAVKTQNPSFLAVHPNRRFLYSVSEGDGAGAVNAFSINAATGQLTLINSVSSKGAGPCYVGVDNTGKYVFVANYGSGSIAAFPVKDDGGLGDATAFIQHKGSSANPQRQSGPHAHYIHVSPDNRFVIVADLGLDEVLVYRFDASVGTLTPNQFPYAKVDPGAGPRHFAFHPNGRFGYVVTEMGSTVVAFTWNGATGQLRNLQTISALPKGFTGESTGAEIAVHPNGKFLYSSNRGDDSIAVFSINPGKGTLKLDENVSVQGKEPRFFTLDPTGRYLFAANQNSDNLVLFHVDQKTGRLTPADVNIPIGAPVCVVFVPTP
ncbi:MAG: lactonase family protein, partial [Bryobacteraceae bacterium]